MIASNRSNRRVRTQDGRAFRRYCRRWKVERVNAWLHDFRRIVTRWEYKSENDLAFVQLACICSLLRQF
jgi:transposase